LGLIHTNTISFQTLYSSVALNTYVFVELLDNIQLVA
jgi:hypothetical protein